MKRSKIAMLACTVALTVACGSALTSCGNDTADASDENVDIYDTSEGVAATVNGTEIGEKAVTVYIESFRTQAALEDDSDWGQWLVDNDYTLDDIREEVINFYANQQLLRQAAEENGVTVNADEINTQIETMRSYYNSDEDWNAALKSANMTEASYRNTLELSMLESGLRDKVATATEPTEDELLQYAQMYALAYDGAKKSSHILFSADDEATAQEVLDKINSGELDFAEAAKEYSQDSSAADGGNVGWDKLTSFVDEYQMALDSLDKGQVSGLVTTSYGIHIIKCTDVFVAPEEVTSIDQVPQEFIDAIKLNLEEQSKDESFSEWYQNYRDSADIQINERPQGLSYDIDLSGFTKTESSNAADDGADSAEGDAADGEDASSEDGTADAPAEGDSADNAAEFADEADEPADDSSEAPAEGDVSVEDAAQAKAQE